MARRKDVHHIAQCVLSQSMDRNSSLDGYWALGRLYFIFIKSKCEKFQFDLINCVSYPQNTSLSYMTKINSVALLSRIENAGIPLEYIKKAEIIAEFDVDQDRKAIWHSHPIGDPCIISITVIFDTGRVYRQTRGTRCLPKNEFGRTDYHK